MDASTANARRKYHHIYHGGKLTEGDVSGMVRAMERKDAEIARLTAERDALAAELAKRGEPVAWDALAEFRSSADFARKAYSYVCGDVKGRVSSVGMHEAKNNEHLRRVYEEAKDAFPRFADTLAWLLWHDILHFDRLAMLVEDHGLRVPTPASAGEPVASCRKCSSPMRPSKAIGQTFVEGMPDFPGDTIASTLSAGGPGELIDCLKCEACGWSVTAPASTGVAVKPLVEQAKAAIDGVLGESDDDIRRLDDAAILLDRILAALSHAEQAQGEG